MLKGDSLGGLRFCGGCGRFGWEEFEADFVDAAAVFAAHGFDPHGEVCELDLVAFPGEALEESGEESGDCGGVRGFDVGAKGVDPVGHGEVAGDEVFVGSDAFDGVCGFVVGFVEVADHLFDDVGEGDDADESAEFIDDDGELRAGLAEVMEEAIEGLLLGDVADGQEDFANARFVEPLVVAGGASSQFEEDGFGVDKSHDVIDLAFVSEDAIEMGIAEEGDEFFGGILDIEGDEIDAGGHDILDAEIGDADDFLEEFVFRDVDDALLLGHFEEFAEFIGGEARPASAAASSGAGSHEAVNRAYDGDVDGGGEGP
jgi:hypothetical protein